MDITLLVKSFIGLVSILAILIFFLFYSPGQKRKKELQKKQEKKKNKKNKSVDFETFLAIVRDKKASSQELSTALDNILEYYGEIEDFKYYGEILLRICRHPQTTKDIILKFNRDLEKKNPGYAIEINDFITRGLNSR